MSEIQNHPSFIIIGCPKGGTGWYYDNLKRHPEVWMPPMKSVHYHSDIAHEIRVKKIKTYKKGIWNALKTAGIGWTFHYLFGHIDNDWYRNLFKPGLGKVTGEDSPTYIGMTRDQVQRLNDFLPKLKILMSVRHPVDRCWSHAMLGLVRNAGRPLETIDPAELKSYFDNPDQEVLTDYKRALELYEEFFPADQICVNFFDDIGQNPTRILKNVCDFLDISYDPNIFNISIKRNLFKGPHDSVHMPPHLAVHLAKKYLHVTEYMKDRFGDHAIQWHERSLRIIESNGEAIRDEK